MSCLLGAAWATPSSWRIQCTWMCVCRSVRDALWKHDGWADGVRGTAPTCVFGPSVYFIYFFIFFLYLFIRPQTERCHIGIRSNQSVRVQWWIAKRGKVGTYCATIWSAVLSTLMAPGRKEHLPRVEISSGFCCVVKSLTVLFFYYLWYIIQ